MFTIRSLLAGHPKPPKETIPLSPITFGIIKTKLGQIKNSRLKTIKILFDSGASDTIVAKSVIGSIKTRKCADQQWNTAGGATTTSEKAIIQFNLPEFYAKTVIQKDVFVFNQELNYDMIIGRDLMTELGINLDFFHQKVKWQEAEIPMKMPNCTLNNSFYVQDSELLNSEADRIKQILDAKYEAADLKEIAEEADHLSEEEKQQLYQLLIKYETLFDGTLGTWKNETLSLKLKADAKPYHARAFPIPKCYELTLRQEVDRLVKIGVLKKVNRSEWAAPTFIIPKKDNTVRFLSDFRELNKRIKRQPFPLPKIQDLMLKLEGFSYATSLDLNMGYYHIELDTFSKELCTIVLPWAKYEYQRLPMGLCNSPDLFQEKMSNLMSDLEYVRTYIDDLLVITNGNWTDHLDKLEQVLLRLQKAGLKCNAKKSFFGKPELEYLGYWITRKGIQPVPKKVLAITNIKPPTTTKEVRSFVGMINYYRDMWIRRSEILAPLTKLCSTGTKFEWGPEQQKSFELIKKIVSQEVMLAYPNFSEVFEIHTDASDYQLGSVISQNGKPIAFYSRKLNPAQRNYTTTERELLAIVETLKEFKNILLGHRIKVYTDHENLTYKQFNSSRVMRWRLLIEEFGPELIYLPGKKNIVADALSRLDIEEAKEATTFEQLLTTNAECFASDIKLPSNVYPVSFQRILKEQQEDSELVELARTNNKYTLKSFRGGGRSLSLICTKDKIIIPKSLQNKIVQWYHTHLCHPGETRTEATIRQHFTWKNLDKEVKKVCSTCPTCQRTKRSTIKYGHLPPKEAEANPWEKLCVDMIGPYTIKNSETGETLTLQCVTMIDPATGWFEMKTTEGKSAMEVANIVEQTWLSRYPWPQEIVYDRGSEFMGDFANMIADDYGITKRPITVRNPQANAIIERIHQTLGNIIRTFELHEDAEATQETWNGILSATMFALRATVHTTTQATPMQLVFGRDAILNVQFEADWKYIKDRKQKIINYNNQKENSKRVPYTYQVNQLVMLDVTGTTKSKYAKNPYQGPYKVLKVNDNGTVVLEMGPVIDTVNIRNVKPYKTESSITTNN